MTPACVSVMWGWLCSFTSLSCPHRRHLTSVALLCYHFVLQRQSSDVISSVTYPPTYSSLYQFTHITSICNYGTLDIDICNISLGGPYTSSVLFSFLVSKVLFVDTLKACLGDFVVKNGRPRVSSKHPGSQMGKNSMWSLPSSCSVLGNEVTYKSSVLTVSNSLLPSFSFPAFLLLLSILSVLDPKPRGLRVLGKCFTTEIQT